MPAHLYDIPLCDTWLQTLTLLPYQLASREPFAGVCFDEREARCTREICLV
jgi:hypothetical protein